MCLVLGMGCRSSKHQNSVSDEVVNNGSECNNGALGDGFGMPAESHVANNKKNSSGGLFTQKNLKVSLRSSGHGSPINKSERPFTQSQVDFFQMLDTKINAGTDYASEDDAGSSVR